MRIGLVCPYSLDAPGGVQIHIHDLANELIARGHEVSVLAPYTEPADLPDHYVSAGKAVPVAYNGSVARLSIGPTMARAAKNWLNTGDFDVIHIHEPFTPSVGLAVLWMARSPIVATFHSAIERSLVRQLASPMLRPLMGKIMGRIAVSAEARRTLVQFEGGDAIVIPNGVQVANYRQELPRPEFMNPQAPSVAFLGRLDEPRKGLAVLAQAIGPVLAQLPETEFYIAGRGEATSAKATLAPYANQVHFLGGISEEDKIALLSHVDCYVAPQTGGESFGIVLVEALAAGTCVLASDIPAFSAVLENGQVGVLFATGDGQALAQEIISVLPDEERRANYATRAHTEVMKYDWSTVTDQIVGVYQTVIDTAAHSPGGATGPGALDLWWDEYLEQED